MRRPRYGRNGFDIRLKRRREVEAVARYVGAADTDDFHTFLMTWMQVRPETMKDPIFTLKNVATRMEGAITDEKATEIIKEARSTPRPRTADGFAERLGVTYAMRQKLGLTTIGAIDVSKRARKKLRKARDRQRQEAKRRARGAKPQVSSLSRQQPWEKLGMSRRSWYRAGKPIEIISGIPLAQLHPQH
jgi:hypothetical protein